MILLSVCTLSMGWAASVVPNPEVMIPSRRMRYRCVQRTPQQGDLRRFDLEIDALCGKVLKNTALSQEMA